MEIIIEGFEEEIKNKLMEKMQDALKNGIEEVVFWSKLMAIKASVSIEGNKIIIIKEAED